MMPKELLERDIAQALDQLNTRAEPFAIATVVRTAGATAAKPGAKAILGPEGDILHGWLGGGCTRSAVKRAALRAMQDSAPQLISVAPEDDLAALGVRPGDTVDGTHFARNGCPSEGTIDIFVEPCLPQPTLAIFGTSPVAHALAKLAADFQWTIQPCAGTDPLPNEAKTAAVIATQGQGDLAALTTTLAQAPDYVAFVGSAKKFAKLSETLTNQGADPAQIARVRAPAGLDIGAVTPEEIALSILAELTQFRRANRLQKDNT